MPIRIAALGAGHWHALYDAAYLKNLAAIPDATLVALHDPDPHILAHRAAALGNPPTYTDHRALLRDVRPDFVIAMGRHDAMAGLAHDLLDAGVPFLIEKPAGLNAAEVRALADKSAVTGTFAGVPLFQRLHPFVAHARRLIADGAFGPLAHFAFRSIRGTSGRYVEWGCPWMLDPDAAGGGCLRNIGTHGIDLFGHILDEDTEVVAAQTSNIALGQRVEDTALVQLRSASGVLASIEVANTYPGKGAQGGWTLSGRDGLLMITGGAVRWITASGEAELAPPPAEPLPVTALKDALDRWQSGRPPAATLEQAWRVNRLIDDAYEMAARP